MSCNYNVSNAERRSKADPLEGTNPLLIGTWAQRLRPSFKVYDYARILSWRHMRERGVAVFPTLAYLEVARER